MPCARSCSLTCFLASKRARTLTATAPRCWNCLALGIGGLLCLGLEAVHDCRRVQPRFTNRRALDTFQVVCLIAATLFARVRCLFVRGALFICSRRSRHPHPQNLVSPSPR